MLPFGPFRQTRSPDSSSVIRIQWYKIIDQMPEERPGWVERSVDVPVLVQLLQSGHGEYSSDEKMGHSNPSAVFSPSYQTSWGKIVVVKTAFSQYLELD
jgi:hypothetical protein